MTPTAGHRKRQRLPEQCREVLRILDGWGAADARDVAQARELSARSAQELGGAGPIVASVDTVAIPAAGGDLPARLYRPAVDDVAGVLVWLHGGGWVVGSVDGSDAQVRALASASGCVVVSVEYRLAPEHRFPGPLEDAVAAVWWAADHARELGAPTGAVAVGGDSAGGNLAASACLVARDRGGPPLACQLLIYPVTCRHFPTLSRERFGDGHGLTLDAMEWYWDQYLTSADDAVDAYASPLLATSLADLPPAIVMLAECDLLRDEGLRYAVLLDNAGVDVTLRCYDGMLHGFVSYAGLIEQGWVALEEAGRAVRDAVLEAPGSEPGAWSRSAPPRLSSAERRDGEAAPRTASRTRASAMLSRRRAAARP